MKHIRQTISVILITAFISTSVVIPNTQAQVIPLLPTPGVRVSLSPEFMPAQLAGMTIDPKNALNFDFLIHKGDKALAGTDRQEEYQKLIKYFLASLTIPEQDQWVNLSPYEKQRIIQDSFGKTEMGRDLLTQDYILKQITASLIYPEEHLGQKFWDTVYERAHKEYGTTQVPVNTFNKVWIVPDEAVVYESGNTAYILKSHLKVMLEEDYLSLEKHSGLSSPKSSVGDPDTNKSHALGSQIIKEIILPELEKEVNEGKNFAQLRQIYSGMILATWYKKALKESLLGRIYADKAKVKGVGYSLPPGGEGQGGGSPEHIYQQYLQAFKKGVFNFIKEDVDRYTQETIPRKYFSGGFEKKGLDRAMVVFDRTDFEQANAHKPSLLTLMADLARLKEQMSRSVIYDMVSARLAETEAEQLTAHHAQALPASDAESKAMVADVVEVFFADKGKSKVFKQTLDKFLRFQPMGQAQIKTEVSDAEVMRTLVEVVIKQKFNLNKLSNEQSIRLAAAVTNAVQGREAVDEEDIGREIRVQEATLALRQDLKSRKMGMANDLVSAAMTGKEERVFTITGIATGIKSRWDQFKQWMLKKRGLSPTAVMAQDRPAITQNDLEKALNNGVDIGKYRGLIFSEESFNSLPAIDLFMQQLDTLLKSSDLKDKGLHKNIVRILEKLAAVYPDMFLKNRIERPKAGPNSALGNLVIRDGKVYLVTRVNTFHDKTPSLFYVHGGTKEEERSLKSGQGDIYEYVPIITKDFLAKALKPGVSDFKYKHLLFSATEFTVFDNLDLFMQALDLLLTSADLNPASQELHSRLARILSKLAEDYRKAFVTDGAIKPGHFVVDSDDGTPTVHRITKVDAMDSMKGYTTGTGVTQESDLWGQRYAYMPVITEQMLSGALNKGVPVDRYENLLLSAYAIHSQPGFDLFLKDLKALLTSNDLNPLESGVLQDHLSRIIIQSENTYSFRQRPQAGVKQGMPYIVVDEIGRTEAALPENLWSVVEAGNFVVANNTVLYVTQGENGNSQEFMAVAGTGKEGKFAWAPENMAFVYDPPKDLGEDVPYLADIKAHIGGMGVEEPSRPNSPSVGIQKPAKALMTAAEAEQHNKERVVELIDGMIQAFSGYKYKIHEAIISVLKNYKERVAQGKISAQEAYGVVTLNNSEDVILFMGNLSYLGARTSFGGQRWINVVNRYSMNLEALQNEVAKFASNGESDNFVFWRNIVYEETNNLLAKHGENKLFVSEGVENPDKPEGSDAAMTVARGMAIQGMLESLSYDTNHTRILFWLGQKEELNSSDFKERKAIAEELGKTLGMPVNVMKDNYGGEYSEGEEIYHLILGKGNLGQEEYKALKARVIVELERMLQEVGPVSRLMAQDMLRAKQSWEYGRIGLLKYRIRNFLRKPVTLTVLGLSLIGAWKGKGLLVQAMEPLKGSPFYEMLFPKNQDGKPVSAINTKTDRSAELGRKDLGGIDLNAANLNLQIKRDGAGVPLPINQQDLENINIEGLFPVIRSIEPVTTLPILSELQSVGASST